MDTHTGTMDTTMARGLLMPSLRPLLMDTLAMDTMAMPMPMDTMHTHMPTTMATSMARGLLMLSPLLMLPMLTMAMDMDTMAMDMPTMDTMATLMPTMDTMDIIINLSSLFVKI